MRATCSLSAVAPASESAALLDYAVHSAAGLRVLLATGVESEMELAFAALHQLCAPMLDRLDGLPAPQRDALETVFGMKPGARPDRFLVGLAVLGLLADVSSAQPLLCVMDDAQWLDRASAQVLAFVARRLLAESVVFLFGTCQTGSELLGLPELEVTGLRAPDSHALLNRVMPAGLDQQIRDRIVAETHGNPLALLELPRGLSMTQMASGLGLLQATAVPGRIEESFLARIEELPEATRMLLLLASAEPLGDPDLVWRAAHQLGVMPDAALAVGQMGCCQSTRASRSATRSFARLCTAPRTASDRRAAHLALATVTDEEIDPDRRAWHLAAATAGQDEEVAAELERSAGRAQARGGLAAMAAFLQRSVALSTDASRRAERGSRPQTQAFGPAISTPLENTQRSPHETRTTTLRAPERTLCKARSHSHLGSTTRPYPCCSRRPSGSNGWIWTSPARPTWWRGIGGADCGRPRQPDDHFPCDRSPASERRRATPRRSDPGRLRVVGRRRPGHGDSDPATSRGRHGGSDGPRHPDVGLAGSRCQLGHLG